MAQITEQMCRDMCAAKGKYPLTAWETLQLASAWMQLRAPSHPTGGEPARITDARIAEIAERMEASDPTAKFWRDFARALQP